MFVMVVMFGVLYELLNPNIGGGLVPGKISGHKNFAVCLFVQCPFGLKWTERNILFELLRILIFQIYKFRLMESRAAENDEFWGEQPSTSFL